MIYNNAYRKIAGERRLMALDTSAAAIFPEVWDWKRQFSKLDCVEKLFIIATNRSLFNRVERSKILYLDLFCRPVYDADGHVGDVMCTT